MQKVPLGGWYDNHSQALVHHNNNHVTNNNTLSHQNNHQVNNGSSRFINSNHHHHQNNHYNNVVEPLQQQQQLQENGDIFNMPSRMNAPSSLPISQRNNHNHQLQKDMSCGMISGGGIGGINNSLSQHKLECIESNLLYQQTPSESSCTESSTDSSTEEEGWESGESDDYNLNENFNALPLNSFLNLDDKNTSTTYFSASIKHSNNNDENNSNINNNNNNNNDSNNINKKCSSSLEMTNNEKVIGDEISFNEMRPNHHQHQNHDHSHGSYNSLNNVLSQQQQQPKYDQHHHYQRQDNEFSLVPLSTATLLTNNYYQYQLNNKSNRKLFTKSNKKKYLKKRKVLVTGDGLNVHESTLIDLNLKITKKQKITVLPRQMSNDPQFRDAVIKNFKSNFNQTNPLSTPQQLTLLSSVDYYSYLCDRQLSLGSPFKSPKDLQTYMSSSPFLKDGNVDMVNKGNGQVESLIVVPKPIDSNDIGFNVEIRTKGVPVVEDAAAVVVVDDDAVASSTNNNNNNLKTAVVDSTISSFYNRFSSIFKKNATNDTIESVRTTETQLSNDLVSNSTPTQHIVAQRGNNTTHVTDFLANCISPTVPRCNRRNPFKFNEIRHVIQTIDITKNSVVDNKAIDNVNSSK